MAVRWVPLEERWPRRPVFKCLSDGTLRFMSLVTAPLFQGRARLELHASGATLAGGLGNCKSNAERLCGREEQL